MEQIIIVDMMNQDGEEVKATLKINGLLVTLDIPNEGLFTGNRQDEYPYVAWEQDTDVSFDDILSWYFTNKVEPVSQKRIII